MSLSRREFLAASSTSLLMSGCSVLSPSSAAGQRQINKIGIQTYTLREALKDDFVGTFQMIKDVGYDYVELYGQNFSDRSPSELRALLDDIALPAPITHIDYNSLANDTSRVADTASVLGCAHIILPWVPDDLRSLDDYKSHAAMLNLSAEKLKAQGITTGYHNHHFEFLDLGDGQIGMEILLSQTDPDLVYFELDVFWAELAGVDIADLFKRHPGRFRYCHVKDMAGAAKDAESLEAVFAQLGNFMKNVGEGDLPFETYFAMRDLAGLEYFIVEHDIPPRPFRQSIAASYQAMRAMRF